MPKKGINGREKGKEYERTIAKLISSWWGEEFHRVPASGGLHWKRDNRVSGDLVPPENSLFPYSIECKKHEDWILDQVLKGTGEVESWWQQCVRDANTTDKRPLLIFSKNRAPNYFMMYDNHFSGLLYTGIYPFRTFTLEVPDEPARVIGIFDEFIQYINKPIVIKSYKLQRRVRL